MTDKITIEIVGKDGASKVFEAVVDAAEEFKPAIDGATSSARKLGPAADAAVTAIKPLDKEMAEAGKAAKEAGTSIERSARSLGDYKSAADKAGQGLGLLGASFALYANQAREHEITVMAIERVYGEAAQSYIDLANRMQSTTIFSNDEVLEATRLMGTLRENYGLTDRQIQELIQRSADLAAMHGLTLTDAAMRVQSAIRGEAESAEALGLTMNQAAIDTKGLTLSMTNAEAAAFRLDAFMKQSTSSMGFAADAADTAAGKTQQLANRTQDAALRFVDFTGPVGQAAGGLASFGVEAGLAVGGIGQLVRGIGDLNKTAGGARLLGSLTTVIGGGSGGIGLAGAIAAAGTAALIASPAVLTLGGAVAYLAIEQGKLMGTMDEQTDTLTKWASSMGRGGQIHQDLVFFAQDIRDMTTTVREFDPFAVQFTGADTTLQSAFDELMRLTPEYFRKFEAALLEGYGITIGNLDQLTSDQLQSVYEMILSAFAEQTEAGIAQATAVNQSTEAWIDWEQAQNQAAIAALKNTDALLLQTATQADANLALREWLELHGLAAQYDQDQATSAQNQSVEREMANLANRIRWTRLYGDQIDQGTFALNLFNTAGEETNKTFDIMTAEVGDTGRAVVGLAEAMGQLTGSIKDDQPSRAQLAQDYEDAMRAASGLSDVLHDLRASGGSVALDLAINSGGAQQALQSGYNAIVGGTQGMGRIAEQTADWAGSLAHASGEFTELDKLVLKGQISMTTYNRALDANHRIQQANIDVQEDVLRIQAKQLPVMAELAEEHARYIDQLADEDVQTQTVALGYMDQTKAAQAMSLANLAATASMSGMDKAAGEMITSMAEADPILKAMLLDMELIRVGADGKIEMNTDSAVSATEVLSTLNGTLGTLNDLLADIFLVMIGVDDTATPVINEVKNALADLDGQTSTVYINTIGGGLTLGVDARDGGVIGYANGGMVMAQLAEVGPELVRLANGGVALAPERGVYAVERGSYVMPAEATRGELNRHRGPAGVTNIYSGQVTQRITFEDSSFARRRAALQGQRR